MMFDRVKKVIPEGIVFDIFNPGSGGIRIHLRLKDERHGPRVVIAMSWKEFDDKTDEQLRTIITEGTRELREGR